MTDKQDKGLLLTKKEKGNILEHFGFDRKEWQDYDALPNLLQAQLAKANQHYEKISPYALPSDAYDKYFTPPEKGLDRPELREILEEFGTAIRVIIDEANEEKTQMVLVIAKCSTALEKAFDQILALIPDMEEGLQILKQEVIDLNKKLDDREADLVEAKREERIEIGEYLSHCHHLISLHDIKRLQMGKPWKEGNDHR